MLQRNFDKIYKLLKRYLDKLEIMNNTYMYYIIPVKIISLDEKLSFKNGYKFAICNLISLFCLLNKLNEKEQYFIVKHLQYVDDTDLKTLAKLIDIDEYQDKIKAQILLKEIKYNNFDEINRDRIRDRIKHELKNELTKKIERYQFL